MFTQTFYISCRFLKHEVQCVQTLTVSFVSSRPNQSGKSRKCLFNTLAPIEKGDRNDKYIIRPSSRQLKNVFPNESDL